MQSLCSRFRAGDGLCRVFFTPYRSIAAHCEAARYRRSTKVNALTWKSMLAALNPSPLFEAVAAVAEEWATRDKRPDLKPILTQREKSPCRKLQR